MRGIKSNGMLLCASNDAHDVVEPLAPPEGATPGQRIVVPEDDVPEPKSANQVAKKKIWEKVQPSLNTSADCVVRFEELPFMTSKGACVVSSVKGGGVA